MKPFIALALCAALSAQAELVTVAQSDTTLFEIESTSFGPTTTRGGIAAYKAYGQVSDGKNVYLNQWYVHLSDCSKTVGRLHTADMDGNFIHSSVFIVGGKSVAVAIAEALCAAARTSKGTAL